MLREIGSTLTILKGRLAWGKYLVKYGKLILELKMHQLSIMNSWHFGDFANYKGSLPQGYNLYIW